MFWPELAPFAHQLNDMLTFIEANLHTPDSVLGHAMALSQALHVKDPPPPKLARAIESLLNKLRRNTTRPKLEDYRGGIGLGWFLLPNPHTGQMTHWHNGGTGGYTSYAGFSKNKSVGVVVLANNGAGLRAMLGKHSVDAIGRNILLSL